VNEDFSIQSMSYACPRCQTFWGTIKSAHDSAVLCCRKCQNRWEVFSIGAQINAFPNKEKRDELANLRKRIDGLTKQRNDALTQTNSMRNEIHSLENQLEASRKLAEGLESENADLRNSRTAWKKADDVLREENRRLIQLLDESTKSGIASDNI